MSNPFENMTPEDLKNLKAYLDDYFDEKESQEPKDESQENAEQESEAVESSQGEREEEAESSQGDTDPSQESESGSEEGATDEGEDELDFVDESPVDVGTGSSEDDDKEELNEDEEDSSGGEPVEGFDAEDSDEDEDDEEGEEVKKTARKSSKSKSSKKKKGKKDEDEDDEEEEEEQLFLSPASYGTVKERFKELNEQGEVSTLGWEIIPPEARDDVPVLRFYYEETDVTIVHLALTERVTRHLRDGMSSTLAFYRDERLEKRREEERKRMKEMSVPRRTAERSKNAYKSARKRFGPIATIGAVFFGLILVVVLGVSIFSFIMNSELMYHLLGRG